MQAVLKSVLVRAILLGLVLGGVEFFDILRDDARTVRDAFVEAGYMFFFTIAGRGFVEGGIDMVRAATNTVWAGDVPEAAPDVQVIEPAKP